MMLDDLIAIDSMTVLVGNNACDVYAMFTEHRRAVEAVRRG